MKLSLRGRLIAWALPGLALVTFGAFAFAWLGGQSVSRQQDMLWQGTLARGRDLLSNEEHELVRAVGDNAFWDGLVNYVDEAPDEAFELNNLGPWLLDAYHVDLVVVLDANSRAVYASDPTGWFRRGETYTESPFVRFAAERPAQPALIDLDGTRVWAAGGTIHSETSTIYEPPGAGTILLGRVLDEAYLERLHDRLGHRVQLVALDGPEELDHPGDQHRATGIVLHDAEGLPVAELSVTSSSPATSAPVRVFWALATYLFAVLVAGFGLLVIAAGRTIVAPLVALQSAIRSLRNNEPIDKNLVTHRDDELGQVAREFVSLANDLESSELSLTRSENKRLTLLLGIPDTILLVGSDGIVLEATRPESHSAMDLSTSTGARLNAVLPNDVATRIMRSFEDSDAERITTFEFTIEGDPRSAHFEARVVRSASDEAVVILRDVSKRKKAESSKERLISIINNTPDFVATSSVDGGLRHINPAGRAMLGIAPDEDVSALTLSEIAGVAERSRIEAIAIPQAIRQGVWTGESTITNGEARDVPVSQVLLAHHSNDGAVEFFSTIARDIGETKKLESQLVYLTDHDPLTDLYGRKRFREELERELSKAVRHGVAGAVLIIDLDEFKQLNDSLGHGAGDAFLASLAKMLGSQTRETDVVARLGGDEFAVLITFATRAGARAAANSVHEAIRQHQLALEGRSVGLTASLGVALFPEHSTNADELLAYADVAMYQSKRNGRNQVTIFEPDDAIAIESNARFRGESDIRAALEEGRFALYAQPVWNLARDEPEWHEILIRMIDEEGRLLLPGGFLGTAERYGLIQSIDRWVVTESIRALSQCGPEKSQMTLSVNLSAKAFTDSELIDIIKNSLSTANVHPSRLFFEVTETAAVADTGQAQSFLTELRRLGCRFALDDFGVGFSSLYHLKHLPVDHLKIDGSFVRDLASNPVDQHLVKAIVEVARALGKKTVAEYVGDQETVELLKEFGVDYGQGFFLGRPVPLEQVLGPQGVLATVESKERGGADG